MEVLEGQGILHHSHQVLVYGLCPTCLSAEEAKS